MTSQEVVQRTPQEQLVSQVRSPEFRGEVALALPENVTPQRFIRVAITALQANASLAELERQSVYRALLQSAAMGLLPDGREAAIVPFKGKAQLIPMIAGYRLIAADYGWTIYTAIAYENDVFEYEQGLDVIFRHVPVRPGGDRGEAIAAYAVGKHQDGRRELEVLTVEEIEKVRAVSQTATKPDAPWTQWWEQMAEKTAGKRLFKKLPLSEDDKRVRIVRASMEPAEAVAAIYGPQGEQVDRSTGELVPAREVPADLGAASESQQAGEAGPSPEPDPPASPVPGEEDDPEPSGEPEQASLLDTPAHFVVPDSAGKNWRGKTLAEVAAVGEKGEEYLAWVARNPGRVAPELHAALQKFRSALFAEEK